MSAKDIVRSSGPSIGMSLGGFSFYSLNETSIATKLSILFSKLWYQVRTFNQVGDTTITYFIQLPLDNFAYEVIQRNYEFIMEDND